MHVFLSPHYDDAIYSCGGTIHQLARRGEKVLIMTIMGGDPPTPLPDTPIVRDLHQRWDAGMDPIATRRLEDVQAVGIVGSQTHHMDIPDCVYRTDEAGMPLYPDEDSLWRKVHPQDPALKQFEWPSPQQQMTHLYVPMGVGEHVDHLVVRDIGIGLVAGHSHIDEDSVLFYPEYPYSEQPEAVQAAISALPNSLSLTPYDITLTNEDVTAKIAGVKAYQSQISTFWQDEATLEARVRASLAHHSNTSTERFYRIQQGTATP